jgi:endonuclease/exonuclease/phosphatase family metal-dependent hydrolase
MSLVAATVPTQAAAALGERGELRILQQNVWTPLAGAGPEKQRRLAELVAAARSYDVLLLQEVFHCAVLGASVGGFGTWLIDELQSAGFTHFLRPKPAWFRIQDSGLLIASRFPLVEGWEIVFQSWRGKEAWTWKGALGAKVEVPNGPPMAVVSTHLQAWQGQANAEVRLQQAQQLEERLRSLGWADTLIAGDLNMDGLADDGEYAAMLAALQPVRDPAHAAALPTYPSRGPRQRLDYVLHRAADRWTLRDVVPVQIGASEGEKFLGMSDHLGVEAVFACR